MGEPDCCHIGYMSAKQALRLGYYIMNHKMETLRASLSFQISFVFVNKISSFNMNFSFT